MSSVPTARRASLRDPALAADLYRRVLSHVPARMLGEIDGERLPLAVTGVHLPIRIYRYVPGQQFGLHQDQSYFGEEGTMSLLTLMVYLNDGFEGGETEFRDRERPSQN